MPGRSIASCQRLTPCVTGLILALASCASEVPETLRIVDLVHEVTRAEMRPARSSFEIVDHVATDRSRPSIRTTTPSRLVFTLPIPRRGVFRTVVTLGGTDPAPTRFRIGISDDRIYEALADRTLTTVDANQWTEMQTDLSAYAGWKWSLFYRPERQRWRLVLSTDVLTGVPSHAVWGVPAIYADVDSAKEYARRSLSLNP